MEPDVIVKSQMLIRRSLAECYEAFVNPEITTKFWFTKSDGRLEPGKNVRWEWEMFSVSDVAIVKALEENRRIVLEWEGDPTTVEWEFEALSETTTLVKISNWGFIGDLEAVMAQAIDAKGGYTIVLAGLKALLEHGIELDLVRDQFPDGCRM